MRLATRDRIVVCDFNGTISDKDMLVTLASSCGERSLPEMFDEAPFHTVSLRERLASLGARVTLTCDEAERILEEQVHFDWSFVAFAQACREHGITLLVVTSGIEDLIERFLARRGVSGLDIRGNRADYKPDGWRLHFRDDTPDGNAKSSYIVQAHQEHKKAIVIGDDESDFEAAILADRRFSKRDSPLDHFLREKALPHVAFDSFEQITRDIVE